METDSSKGKLISVPPEVMFQELKDELVVANLDSGVYFAMNEVAANIWKLLANASSIDEVVSGMLNDYEVAEETLRADVTALVDELQEQGLITLNNA